MSAYWNLISNATHSRVHMKNIGPLKRSDGSLVVADDEKARLMNSHFALVGEKRKMPKCYGYLRQTTTTHGDNDFIAVGRRKSQLTQH